MARLPGKKSKTTQTVRERTTSQADSAPKRRRLQRTASRIANPLSAAKRLGAKEYNLPIAKGKEGKFLHKRRSFVPRYFLNSWQELKQVKWPGRRETRQLTIAVFIFAIVFSIVIAVTDYGLDKLFRKVLIK